MDAVPAKEVRLGHRLEDLGVGSVSALLRVLPEPLALALGGGLGWLAGSVLRIRRRTVDENLALAFPERSRRWRRRVAARVFPHIGREAGTVLRMAALGPDQLRARTRVEGYEELEAALADGKGILILAGHLGNWEIGGGAVAVRGIPLDVVAQRQKNRRVNRRLEAARQALGMSVIYREHASRQVLRSLRKGRAVALVADQNVRSGGVFVDFFGTPASTARGPALFALRSGAPAFLAAPVRLAGWRARYHVRFRPLRLNPSGDLEADVRGFTRCYLAALEEEIRSAPHQYFWPHRRWKTRPPSAPTGEELQGRAPV